MTHKTQHKDDFFQRASCPLLFRAHDTHIDNNSPTLRLALHIIVVGTGRVGRRFRSSVHFFDGAGQSLSSTRPLSSSKDEAHHDFLSNVATSTHTTPSSSAVDLHFAQFIASSASHHSTAYLPLTGTPPHLTPRFTIFLQVLAWSRPAKIFGSFGQGHQHAEHAR